ncbi:MAG TPA: hypothetical protein VNI58_07365 [Mariprofundaceae bacterium]|nr:hypothetical protein [Mariprofundaceae bacterium]
MRQQRLGLNIPRQFNYGDWVRHPGVERAVSRLALWLVEGGRLWLRSSDVAGKTHLLHALQQEHPRLGVVQVGDAGGMSSLQQVEQWVRQLEGKAFWAADVQAGPLAQASALALFHLLERARDRNRPILVAWRCETTELTLPELRSRLHAMEHVDMSAPDRDTDLLAVLNSVASTMQWQIPEGALEALTRFLPRELEVLLQALRILDEQHAVGSRKRVTRTWVLEQLEQTGLVRASGVAA